DAPGLPAHGELQGVVGALVFSMAMVALPGGFKDVAELGELEECEKIVGAAGTPAFSGGIGIVAGRQDDDANVGPTTTDFLNQPESAATGHEQIRHDNRRGVLFEQFDGLL